MIYFNPEVATYDHMICICDSWPQLQLVSRPGPREMPTMEEVAYWAGAGEP